MKTPISVLSFVLFLIVDQPAFSCSYCSTKSTGASSAPSVPPRSPSGAPRGADPILVKGPTAPSVLSDSNTFFRGVGTPPAAIETEEDRRPRRNRDEADIVIYGEELYQ